jgi:hypothetical protein
MTMARQRPSAPSWGRPWWVRPLGLLALAFGLLTLKAGGSVLLGGEAAGAAAGAYVPFVVWINLLLGFAYVVAGVGLWRWRRWTAPLAATIAVITLTTFAAFGLHVALGGAYETRTVAAMAVRSLFWLGVTGLACRGRGCRSARLP